MSIFIIFISLFLFVFWCMLRTASREDEQMEKLKSKDNGKINKN